MKKCTYNPHVAMAKAGDVASDTCLWKGSRSPGSVILGRSRPLALGSSAQRGLRARFQGSPKMEDSKPFLQYVCKPPRILKAFTRSAVEDHLGWGQTPPNTAAASTYSPRAPVSPEPGWPKPAGRTPRPEAGPWEPAARGRVNLEAGTGRSLSQGPCDRGSCHCPTPLPAALPPAFSSALTPGPTSAPPRSVLTCP